MNAYERLMAEAIPTRPTPPPAPSPPRPWTPEEQARHRADLLEALADWVWDEDDRADQRRRLHLVNTSDTEAA